MSRLRNHNKVWLVGATFVLGAVAVFALVGNQIRSRQATLTGLQRRDQVIERRLGRIAANLALTRIALTDAAREPDPTQRAAQLQLTLTASAAAASEWKAFAKASPSSASERALRRQFERAAADAQSAGRSAGLAILAPPAGAVSLDTAINTDLAAVDQEMTAVAALHEGAQAKIRETMAALQDYIRETETTAPLSLALALFVGLVVTGLCARSVRRQERALHNQEVERDEAARRNAFDARISRAMEMAATEDHAFDLTRCALQDGLGSDTAAELLLADSSRAHFRQVFATDPAIDGCAVVAPADCPATNRGVTLTFESNSEIDTCPHLRDLGGARSAVCVPVGIGGQAIGVIRTDGADWAPPRDGPFADLELVARKTGDRVGMLRAFADSETQARTDPLTGLLNRRSLENRVRELVSAETPYVIAYGDLDHFKDLNDTHGHETGDRALRLFARVLREALRPNDVPARYGGEEFVVVLPDCTVSDAIAVIERVRENLAIALSSGSLPTFTASFGVATGEPQTPFDEIVPLADDALHTAKRDGRNRVIAATRPAEVP